MSPKYEINKINKIVGGPITHELLIEIGTEEMPANYLAYANDPENDPAPGSASFRSLPVATSFSVRL